MLVLNHQLILEHNDAQEFLEAVVESIIPSDDASCEQFSKLMLMLERLGQEGNENQLLIALRIPEVTTNDYTD